MDSINTLLPALEHFRMLGYWVVLLFSLLESLAFVGVVIPGAVVVVFAGSLAAKGFLDLGDLVWFASAGAVLGDGISFRMGKGGHIRFREENRIFKPALLDKGKQFFGRHGGKSIFLGRFVGLIRAVIPFVAGLSGMEAKRFYLWNIASAVLWAASHLLAGYFLGQAWRMVGIWSTRFGVVLAAVMLLAIGAWWLKRFAEKRGREFIGFIGSVLSALGKTVAADPHARKVVANHPAFFAFVGKRLDRTEFSGLPLTLLGTAFLYILLLLAGVVEDVLTMDPIVVLDTRIENLLYAFRDPLLVKVFLWITLLAKGTIVLCISLSLAVLFFLRKQREFILPLLVTMTGSSLFDLLGKMAMQRQRPAGVGVYVEASFSFPSGHSTTAAALYGFAVYFLWRRAATWGTRLNILFAGIFLVAAIGFSRLYLGVHFLSDVLGGYLLGLLWLIIGICMAESNLRKERPPAAPVLPPVPARIVTAGVALACVAFYVSSGLRYSPVSSPPSPRATTVVETTDILKGFDRGLPKYTENILGDRQQPLSVIIVTPGGQILADAFARAGWVSADPLRVDTMTKMVGALISNTGYPAAPVTPSFWNGLVNDLSFEKTTPERTVRERHQARLWKTDLRTADGRAVYVGTAISDAGLKWRVLYRIGPDVDTEREGLLRDLRAAGVVASAGWKDFVSPMTGRNSFGDPYFTAGTITTIHLKGS
jgi:membrane protein DedA with SNARE-associated domain/membrane-associated phospholipid phosphatase